MLEKCRACGYDNLIWDISHFIHGWRCLRCQVLNAVFVKYPNPLEKWKESIEDDFHLAS